LIAGDDLEQRRLAGAVRADQADAVTVTESQAHRIEDQSVAEEQRDVVENHQTHSGRWIARSRRSGTDC